MNQIIKLRTDRFSLSFDGVGVIHGESAGVTLSSQEQRLLLERQSLNDLLIKQNKAV